jgi:tetratricopeptide (TPR) repeat protein
MDGAARALRLVWIGRGVRRTLEEGMRHERRGELEAAAERYESAAVTARDGRTRARVARLAASARLALSLARYHAGRDGESEREIDRALASDPDCPGARFHRARVFHRSGRLFEAIGDLERESSARPDRVEVLLLLAACLGQTGERAGAVRAMDRAMTLELEPRAGTRSLPIAPRHDGEARHVATRLQAALKTRPSYADLRFLLGMALARAGRDVEAEIELERALRINADYLDARLWLARLRLDRGEWRRPRRDLERALDRSQVYPDLHYWLGLAHFRAGDLAATRHALERAVDLHRHYARAHRLLGLLCHRQGRSAEGLRALRLGFARDREAPGAANLRGLCARAREEPERVEAEVRRALYQKPDYPDLHVALARVHRARGALERAREACRSALALRPDYAIAALELGSLELECGRPAAAEPWLLEVTRTRPTWADAQAMLARARRAVRAASVPFGASAVAVPRSA